MKAAVAMRIPIIKSADLKRERFSVLTGEVARQLATKHVTEKAIVRDFNRWRKARRKPGRAAEAQP